LTIGRLIGKATVNRPFFSKLLLNLLLQLVFAIAMAVSIGYLSSLFTIFFFAFIIHVAGGSTYKNYFTYNVTLFQKNAGISGGLIGAVVYVLVSLLTSAIVYILPAMPMASVLLVCHMSCIQDKCVKLSNQFYPGGCIPCCFF
jgi:hypothetical protein